jgi:hypothetical protein
MIKVNLINESELSGQLVLETFNKCNSRLTTFFTDTINTSTDINLELIISNFEIGKSSSADKLTIHIYLKENSEFNKFEWLEFLITHELTHFYCENFWGMAPVIFWEGLPVLLADNYFREKKWGYSYSVICKSLKDKTQILPISDLFRGDVYYGNRRDSRYDFEAASFTDFILQEFGTNKLEQVFKQFDSPSETKPICDIRQLLDTVFNTNISDLEIRWHNFLDNIVINKDSLLSLPVISIPEINSNSERCSLCFAPLNNEKEICPHCNKKLVNITYNF